MSELIFNEEYVLTSQNYYDLAYDKKQIVIGNSLSADMGHWNRWTIRRNGSNKATTPFTISLDGTIYKHYDPSFYSDVVRLGNCDREIIGITLENEGFLEPLEEKKVMVNWIGDIYNRKTKVFSKSWRDRQHWAPYSRKQIASLSRLCAYLCKEYSIPFEFIGHNTELTEPTLYEGIMFRSNYSKFYFDVSPAFDFEYFKLKLKQHNNE